MAGTTIGDLNTLRARRIAKVVTVHLAIEALDAVIAEGNDEPESPAQLHAPK
jgi:hypothetical protein